MIGNRLRELNTVLGGRGGAGAAESRRLISMGAKVTAGTLPGYHVMEIRRTSEAEGDDEDNGEEIARCCLNSKEKLDAPRKQNVGGSDKRNSAQPLIVQLEDTRYSQDRSSALLDVPHLLKASYSNREMMEK